jgi:hypothetical protein
MSASISESNPLRRGSSFATPPSRPSSFLRYGVDDPGLVQPNLRVPDGRLGAEGEGQHVVRREGHVAEAEAVDEA